MMHKKGKMLIIIIEVIILVTAISLLLSNCLSEPHFSEDEWLASVRSTDISQLYEINFNEKNKTFFNPWMARPKPDVLRMIFLKRKTFPSYPKELYTQQVNNYGYLQDTSFDIISFVGHASFFIKMNGETIITDPLFSDRVAIQSTETKINMDYTKIPERSIVLISHNHYDHLDRRTIKELIKKNSIFLVPMKLKKYIESWGAKDVYELNWWENITIGDITYTFVPEQHWSMRVAIGNGGGKTLWGGWIIEGTKKIYFSGDTGYFRGFEEFGRRWEIDYALMGVGAYEPRWSMHYVHMSPYEFIKAVDDIGAKKSIPMHFGIMQAGDEPINYPIYILDEFIKNNPEYDKKIKLLKVGEYFVLEKNN